MKDTGYIMDTSLLSYQKRKYLFLIKTAYAEMNQAYNDLKAKFGQLYPQYSRIDIYEITNVDFWLGSVACNYDGRNHDLCFKLFELNDKLRNVDAFDLSELQVIEIYNTLTFLCEDVYGHKFKTIESTDLKLNEIIDKLKRLTDYISKANDTQNLSDSIQKLYVLIDFALYEDDLFDQKHFELRNLREEYLFVQSVMYDSISIYENKINLIDDQLNKIK